MAADLAAELAATEVEAIHFVKVQLVKCLLRKWTLTHRRNRLAQDNLLPQPAEHSQFRRGNIICLYKAGCFLSILQKNFLTSKLPSIRCGLLDLFINELTVQTNVKE